MSFSFSLWGEVIMVFAVAPVAVRVGARAHELLVREAVARVLATPVALRLTEDLLAPLAPGDGVGRAAHQRPLFPSRVRTWALSGRATSVGRDMRRLRFGDLCSSMWLEYARFPRRRPVAVLRNR